MNSTTSSLLEILDAGTAERYREVVVDAVTRTAERFATVGTPTTDTPAATLRDRVDAVDLDVPLGTADAAVAEVDRLFSAEAVWFHQPGYLAHLNCPVALPAVAAEAVLAAVNPSVDTWDQSRIGTEIERRVVRWATETIGFPAGDGVFTSGGSQSNLHALLLARQAATATAPQGGPALDDLVVFATASSHFSVRKSAMVLGLPERAVVDVATDGAGRMQPDALAHAIAAVRREGRVPTAVVATAGTTDRGCIDPLGPIADVCDLEDVWLHVDAAYGCGLLVSPTRRHLLDGIERARSVTADFHKSFFQPVSSSALLVRDPADLRRAAWHADYLNPEDADEPNQVDKSLQTTRRFDALKLWATLRASGAAAIGRAFDTVIDVAEQVHEHVRRHPDLVLVAPTQLSTVLFRWQPEGVSDAEADALVAPLRAALLAEGRALVAKTVVDGRPCDKLTLLNPATSVEQVVAALDHVVATAERLHAARLHAGRTHADRGERAAHTTETTGATR
ncbi:pyridoxal-dependent decarboxylase [Curtobacterium sp. MCBA15_012]|uniref:pyridoxal phosphate-dependent decarboxylase family protein n=1 Tax=Curtobacterium sp. MCBA15_012 TaxID=1898738 RepID=UPI000A7844EC|nr:pyridoxal-dependent decarboxylase [Curtobacterium sp. MCBA15_012]WIA98933.1 pyridoxal-dependent decarboxylase [Curtobacterium sp. MCBA15_012]